MITEPFPVETAPSGNVPGPSAAAAAAIIPMTAIKRNERKLFRKSHSDTNALRNPENGNHGPSRPLPTHGPPREERNTDNSVANNDTGPWTAEALDFFDWWPPGRPIPT